MKKIKVEVEHSLTYTPFENIGELLKKAKKEEKDNGEVYELAVGRLC